MVRSHSERGKKDKPEIQIKQNRKEALDSELYFIHIGLGAFNSRSVKWRIWKIFNKRSQDEGNDTGHKRSVSEKNEY